MFNKSGNKSSNELEDSSWIRQSLLVGGITSNNVKTKEVIRGQQFSSSTLIFADTSLGGNRSINPRPQFTRYADPNQKSLLTNISGTSYAGPTTSMGMGRYYGEAIDGNASRIYMQFGVPAFNSLTNFFTTYYDTEQGAMVNTGKVGNLLYTIGKYAGYLILWNIAPVLAIGNFLYSTITKLSGTPLSKFYYVKPTMALYWSTVSVIVNALTVNMGLAQGSDDRDSKEPTNIGMSSSDVSAMNKLLPDIMRSNTGGIDIRAVANRYQRLADAHSRRLKYILDHTSSDKELETKMTEYLERGKRNVSVTKPRSMAEYVDGYKQSSFGSGKFLDKEISKEEGTGAEGDDKVDDSAKIDLSRINAAKAVTNIGENKDNPDFWMGLNEHMSSSKAHMTAELREGSSLVSYVIDHVSTVSETFSNSFKSSDIASKMNQTSSASRTKMFNLAGGNVGDGVVADTLEGIIGGVKAVISGALDTVGLGGLNALTGGRAFVDMPDYWENSEVTLPVSTYTIQLRSPYGNSISRLTNELVPLATLLAGVVSRTTGKNSYTSPFNCKLWHEGVNKITVGMISSMTITRGTSNIGRTVNNECAGIDVSFTVINLEKMLHAPISNELSLSDVSGISMFDEDSNFTDYLTTLASVSLEDQYYTSNKWALRRARSAQNVDSWFSATNFISRTVDTRVGGLLQAFARKSST